MENKGEDSRGENIKIFQNFAESCFPLSSALHLIFVLLQPLCLTNRHLAQDVKRRAREKGGKPVSYFSAAEKDKIREEHFGKDVTTR